MMIERKPHRQRRLIVVAWALIWLGMILAVNPRDALSRMGVLLWAAGLVVQLAVIARWLIARPGAGPMSFPPAAG